MTTYLPKKLLANAQRGIRPTDAEIARLVVRCGKRANPEAYAGKPRGAHGLHHTISARAKERARVDAVTEDGKIAVYRHGRDCDCVEYASAKIVDAPRSILAWMAAEDKHQQWLDGPEWVRYGKPSECEEGYASRDRALEAYEDGHPSTVRFGGVHHLDGTRA